MNNLMHSLLAHMGGYTKIPGFSVSGSAFLERDTTGLRDMDMGYGHGKDI